MKTEQKKSRLLRVKAFLEKHSDEEHPVTVADIISHLKNEGIQASRKSVVLDIEQLIADGIDVVSNDGRPKVYFIGDRQFEIPELKLLVDVVQASRFIPTAKTNTLIQKLTEFASYYQAGDLRRSLYTDKLPRSVSEKAYITVDLLNKAINSDRKITFKYYEWGPDKKKIYKHRRQDYIFSPYGLVWNNDRYYTVGWCDIHNNITTFRIDRIATPKLTDEAAVPAPKDFDLAYYSSAVFQMYDGPLRKVTLRCKNDMMRHVIDRFGEEIETEIVDDDHFIAHVDIPASPTFFAWIFTFRGGIKIDEPDDILSAYHDMLNLGLE